MSLQINNLVGFGGGSELIVQFKNDDGDAAPNSGVGGATHTYSSKTSVGESSLVFTTWTNGSSRALSSNTWSLSSMDILIQRTVSIGENVGAAICAIRGGQSGDIVATFDGNVADSHITILSFSNILSFTPLDTDSVGGSGVTFPLDELSPTSDNGVALFLVSGGANSASFSWANATEASDLDAGNFTHSAAYVLGTLAGGVIATCSSSGSKVGVAVALR